MRLGLRVIGVGLLASSVQIGCGGEGGGSDRGPTPATVAPAPLSFAVVRIEAAPDVGFHWPYYLLTPNGRAGATLIVEPNNTGSGDDDPSVHDASARKLAERDMDIAQAVGCALLVPTFPRPRTDWWVYTHALDRDTLETNLANLVRLDLQLLAMVDDARSRLSEGGTDTGEKFIITGYSASGMFANRFCALHPDRIKAAAIGSPGGWPLAPVASWEGQTLRYNVGVADVLDLTGAPFDLARFRTVPLFVYMGDQDTNDSVPYEDGYERQDRDLVYRLFGTTPMGRWPKAEQIYRSVGSNCTFRLYPGVGHTISNEMRRDVIDFIQANATRSR